jgi:ABC-type sugar transport system ATPase subunit
LASIDIDDVRVTIDGRDLLDGATLHVGDGESVAILGPSGCGKTTLLRAVAGLQPVSSGTVSYDGVESTHLDPSARGVGMVFQNYALYPHMQSQGILGFYYRLRGRSAEVGDRVHGVCEIMGADFADLLLKKPSQLSGGQRQRVAIGRCIIREPRLFLFDEPLSALDARLRTQTRVEIKRLLRRFGVTALYVSHDQLEAMAIGDRIAVMRAGRIVQVGQTRDLHDRPRNTFVATFLGSPPMCLVSGVIEAGAIRLVGPAPDPDGAAPAPLGDVAISGAPAEVRLPFLMQPSPALGTTVVLGWRADAVALSGPEASGLWAEVMAVEPVVADRQVMVTTAVVVAGLDGRPASFTIRARATADSGVRVGGRVRITFNVQATHAFQANGERAVAVVYSL